MIYGGSAFSYAHDADFQHLAYSVKRWQEIINEYYTKYKGLKKWHDELVQAVTLTNQLVMPTGRVYKFQPFAHPSRGLIWPRTKILNYPVQGLGADLVAIARVTLRKRMLKQGITEALLVNTVHDSIDIDTPEHLTYNICSLVNDSVEAVPDNFHRLFGKPFNLPLVAEVFYGPNLKEMEKYENYSP